MSFWKSLVTFLTPLPSGERAKNDKGQFIADDKSTPHVNEAYVDGKKPVRKLKLKNSLLGVLAQLGEHLLCKQGVTGSNPVYSTTWEDWQSG